MDVKQRWRNFFANVSHIRVEPTTSEETIRELAIAAKNVENKLPVYDFQQVGVDFMQSNS